MVNLMSWFLRGQCLRHAEPIFDRDETGAIFRCPRCLYTWPRFQSADAIVRGVVPGTRTIPGSVRVRRAPVKPRTRVRRNTVATASA